MTGLGVEHFSISISWCKSIDKAVCYYDNMLMHKHRKFELIQTYLLIVLPPALVVTAKLWTAVR